MSIIFNGAWSLGNPVLDKAAQMAAEPGCTRESLLILAQAKNVLREAFCEATPELIEAFDGTPEGASGFGLHLKQVDGELELYAVTHISQQKGYAGALLTSIPEQAWLLPDVLEGMSADELSDDESRFIDHHLQKEVMACLCEVVSAGLTLHPELFLINWAIIDENDELRVVTPEQRARRLLNGLKERGASERHIVSLMAEMQTRGLVPAPLV